MKRIRTAALFLTILLLLFACNTDNNTPTPIPIPVPTPELTATPKPVELTTEPKPEPKPTEPKPLFTVQEVDYKLSDKLPLELVEHVKEQRKNVFAVATAAGQELFKSYMDEGPTPKLDERIAAVVSELIKGEQQEPPEFITKEEAADEINFIFDYMKCAYSGYGYFGGDTVFLPIKENLLKELDRLADDNERVNVSEYEEILTGMLHPIIKDAHFTIGDVWFARGNAMLFYIYSEELVFYKSGGDYITMVDGKEYTLVSIDGQDAERYIKATLLEDGTFAYVLGESLAEEVNEKPLAVLLKNADGEKSVDVTLQLAGNVEREKDAPIYRSYEKNGVMVLENTALHPNDSPDLGKMDYLSEKAKFKNQKTIIIDVIRNGGGGSGFVQNWAGDFLSTEVSQSILYAFMATKTTQVFYPWGVNPETNWSEPFFNTPKQKANDTVTFLLTGGEGSAGETWTTILREADNVITAGINSVGALEFANVVQFSLQHSKLFFQCGTSLSLMNQDFSPFECVGYQPDLWIDPSLVLERVSRFIERYGLNE